MAMHAKKNATNKGKNPWSGSKADEKQDKKTMQGMNTKQKAAYEKADKKMDAKMPSKKADMNMDKALAKKVKGSCTCGKCAACKAKKKK
jgi:hypothetical protein